MTRRKRLSRRTLLRGAGTVAIALPFLEEMTLARAFAATDGGAPKRLVTLFFGLGLDPSWQRDFNGPLEPYQPFARKMAFFSANAGQGYLGGAHCNTSTVVFVGEQQRSVNVAGGGSIDQIMRHALDPTASTLVSGLFWRRGGCDAQALRVYNPDGSARPPIKRPSEVFDRIFGSYMPPSTATPMPPPTNEPSEPGEPDPAEMEARRAARIRRSILDTVLDEYRFLTGDSSFLGRASKRKLEQHLNAIREIEQELAPADAIIDAGETGMDPGGDTSGMTTEQPMAAPMCEVPSQTTDPNINADYDRFTYGTGAAAPALPYNDVERVFHLHADLYALALRCDLVRYGNLMFESAGGHTNLEGTYSALGESTTFPGSSQHDTYFHGNQPGEARLYQHFAQTNLAYFLSLLDDRDHLEANGQTVLDNACVVIGTEYGWNHSKENVFHAIAGGGGRFRPGFYTDRQMNCIDLYNTILTAYGIDARIGAASGVSSEGDASIVLV